MTAKKKKPKPLKRGQKSETVKRHREVRTRNHVIYFRVNESERKAIEAAAEKHLLPTTTWVRQLVVTACILGENRLRSITLDASQRLATGTAGA